MLEEIDEFDFEHRIVTNEYDTDICDDVDDNHFSIKSLLYVLLYLIHFVRTFRGPLMILLLGSVRLL